MKKQPLHKHRYQTATPAPRFTEATLTVPEYKVLCRMRQLFDSGADIVIVEKRPTGQPTVRTVGKPEK